MFDLRWNYPVLGSEGAIFADYLGGLDAARTMSLLRPLAQDGRAVAAGVAWLGRQGLAVAAEQTFLLAGGHHALSVVLTLLRLDGGQVRGGSADLLELPAAGGKPCGRGDRLRGGQRRHDSGGSARGGRPQGRVRFT